MNTEQKYVAYYRVSKNNSKADKDKNKSKGLSQDAQKLIVNHYYKDNIVKEFEEIESGKNITERPILQAAIEYCLKHNLNLAVAKVDRLSRNVDDVRYVFKALKGKLSCCDIPGQVDLFMLTMYANFAERERELISLRTSQALQAKITREGKWQKSNPDYKSGKVAAIGRAANTEKALTNENNIKAADVICSKIKEGMSIPEIVIHLNNKKYKTARGNTFSYPQVARLIESFC